MTARPASERLRELERQGAEGKWEIYEETHHEPTDDPKYTDRWIMDNGVILNWEEGSASPGFLQLVVTLRNALPLIADVVEAAERVDEFPNEVAEGCTCNFCTLTRALTALRGALEEK